MPKPHVAEYVGIGQWQQKYNYSDTQQLIKRLKGVLHILVDAEKAVGQIEPDVDDLVKLVGDLAWESRSIEDAIEVVEEYEDVNFDDWYDEVEARLTPKEQEEFEQEKIMYKLKGE